MRRPTALVLAAIAVAMVGAGCQGASATLSRQQFSERAGAICEHMREQLEGLDVADEPAAFADAIEQGVPVVDDAIASLSTLAAPPQLRPGVARWLQTYERARSLMDRTAAAARDGRRVSIETWYREFAPIMAAADDGAWNVGAYRCAGEGATAPPKVGSVSYGSTVREVVIDTDMGADDWMAILYILRRPDVHVRAITVSGTGLAHCRPGVQAALRLLALAGKRAPVACGRVRPLRGARHFPRAWRRDADTLLGLTLPGAAASPSGKPAGELLASAVRSAPGSVSLLTLGPLTNVADAFARDPDLAHELDAVFVMGGALTVPGNTPGGAAEWNFCIDPAAAAAVLRAGAPITLVPLDATRQVPLDRSFYEGIKAAHDTPVARFVFDVLTRQRDQIESGGYFFWDPLAAAILTDGLATVERRRLKVATKASLSGWTFAVTGGAPVRVAVDVPRARFEQIFLSVLNRAARP